MCSIVAASMNITNFDFKPHNGNLIGFLGKHVLVEGTVRLKVTLGTWLIVVNIDIDFLTTDPSNNAHNAILAKCH